MNRSIPRMGGITIFIRSNMPWRRICFWRRVRVTSWKRMGRMGLVEVAGEGGGVLRGVGLWGGGRCWRLFVRYGRPERRGTREEKTPPRKPHGAERTYSDPPKI